MQQSDVVEVSMIVFDIGREWNAKAVVKTEDYGKEEVLPDLLASIRRSVDMGYVKHG